jgi:uncharacterized protein YndB with AHSA1/START domain
MEKGLVLHATTVIDAPLQVVWDALVTPDTIRRYFFGAEVISDWIEGGPIVWRGQWQGRSYEDKGTIIRLVAPRLLQYTHFSPLAGLPDTPENYHTVTTELSEESAGTRVRLTQDNSRTEKEREHSEANWRMVLGQLKALLEQPSVRGAGEVSA